MASHVPYGIEVHWTCELNLSMEMTHPFTVVYFLLYMVVFEGRIGKAIIRSTDHRWPVAHAVEGYGPSVIKLTAALLINGCE